MIGESITIVEGNFGGAAERQLPVSEALERLSIVACVDLIYYEGGRYCPIPLFAIDGEVEVTEVTYGNGRRMTRFKALFPNRPSRLIKGAWEGEVDLPIGETSGQGQVYLGQMETTSG